MAAERGTDVALELIVGPPNSGRSGAVLRALPKRSPTSPLLIVPTRDDIARFERDLCAEGASAIGATIRTFGAVFSDIATAAARFPAAAAIAAAAARPDAGGDRRDRPARPPPVIGLAGLRARARQPDRRAPGSPRHLLPRIRAPAEAAGDAELELELADSLREVRGPARRSRHGRRRHRCRKPRRGPCATIRSAWGERPVFIYGFDDLTEAQLGLVLTMAERSPT